MTSRDDLGTLLSAYLDEYADASERRAVEARLAVDAAFRRERADLERLRGWLADLPVEPAPAQFAERVTARLERQSLLTERGAAAARPRWIGLAAAAVLLLAAGLAWRLMPSNPIEPRPVVVVDPARPPDERPPLNDRRPILDGLAAAPDETALLEPPNRIKVRCLDRSTQFAMLTCLQEHVRSSTDTAPVGTVSDPADGAAFETRYRPDYSEAIRRFGGEEFEVKGTAQALCGLVEELRSSGGDCDDVEFIAGHKARLGEWPACAHLQSTLSADESGRPRGTIPAVAALSDEPRLTLVISLQAHDDAAPLPGDARDGR